MKAEIIAVGSELLTPYFQDTNSLFLTEKLNEAGFEVRFKTIVGDREEYIAEVFRNALGRSRLVIFSGGLGPTEDDLTRAAVARVLGCHLVLDTSILEGIERKFASRGYSMPDINKRQAQVLVGAEVLENSRGTAPGLWLEEKGVFIALLPGPPREIKHMFQTEVLPRLQALGGGRRVVRKTFSIAGMTESEVDARVAPIYKTYDRVQTTILAGTSHISLHLSRWLDPGEEPSDLIELASRIQEALGSAIFTTENEPIEAVVGRMLRQAGSSLAVAESCTSGMVGAYLTRIPGSSSYFSGGVLCYSNKAKTDLCRVPEETLERHGAVSGETAEALARGVRQVLGSAIGLSVTGIAGPDGGSAEKPLGLVFVGLSDDNRDLHIRRVLPGDRDAVRERATFFALACLRRFLMPESAAGKP